MRTMRALVWKDARINQFVLAIGACLLAGPFLIGILSELVYAWPSFPRPRSWANLFYSYGYFCLNICPVTMALLAGNVIACERVDRSVEFLAYLPPSRATVLGSKLIVTLGMALVIWGVCLMSMYAIAPSISRHPANYWFMTPGPSMSAAACLLTFGVGWLGSSTLESTTAAVSFAIFSPLILMASLQASCYFLGWPAGDDLEHWGFVACVAAGLLGFAAGTGLYLRRVEP